MNMNNSRMPAVQRHEVRRRSFFLTAALGSAGALFTASRTDAAEWSDTEKANVKIVNDFCVAVSTRDPARVLPFFAVDLVYRPTETTPPVQGHEGLGATVKRWATMADRMEFRVLKTFAAGPIVINRRIDQFTGSRPMRWEGTGVFFVKDGKIKEWSDYTIRLER